MHRWGQSETPFGRAGFDLRAAWAPKSRLPMLRRFVIALAALLVLAPSASAASLAPAERATLQRYAADTWRSFDLMVDARTGLPADNVSADGARSAYTSPTNIGAYLWATVGAHELGLIDRRAADARAARTLDTLAHMER